jgi:hypothetical protein
MRPNSDVELLSVMDSEMKYAEECDDHDRGMNGADSPNYCVRTYFCDVRVKNQSLFLVQIQTCWRAYLVCYLFCCIAVTWIL